MNDYEKVGNKNSGEKGKCSWKGSKIRVGYIITVENFNTRRYARLPNTLSEDACNPEKSACQKIENKIYENTAVAENTVSKKFL